jgi:hypothetical protein
MSAQPNNIQPMPTARPLPAMQVLVTGRVDAVRRYDGKTSTRLTTPAADSYSRPQVVEVRSKQTLGRAGEEISVVCKVGGYTRKAFKVADQETGEIRSITPVDHTLDAVE